MNLGELGPVHACCGAWPDHRYRCPEHVWPATATPEIRRKHARGDCIAPAHGRIEDIVPVGLDHQQRARLTDVLAQTWDDGCRYGAAAERERLFAAIRHAIPLGAPWRGEALDLIAEVWRKTAAGDQGCGETAVVKEGKQ